MRRIRGRYAVAAIGAIVAVGVGTTTFVVAQEEEDGGPDPTAPPGTIYTESDDESLAEAETSEGIVIGGSTFDETTLTKFIPGSAFQGWTGVANSEANFDMVDFSNTSGCVSPATGSEGLLSRLFAPVELPDGSRITQVRLYAVDSAAGDIEVSLFRDNFSVPTLVGSPSRSADFTVTSFSTSGTPGATVVASAALTETVGSFSTAILTPRQHRFHTVSIEMTNAAGAGHVVCGVEIAYQVPAASVTGTVFTPIDPIRAYDSRQAAYAPNNVRLDRNASRVISIKDARDTAGNLVTADVVPANATAITYNITIAGPTGPNFVAVTPGDAASFTASAINFNGTADIANAGTVKIAADRTIKVWGGDQAGSMHIIIDVTGYYTPASANSFPNMGN